MGTLGRIPKYTYIIAMLEENTLYSPASITNFATKEGLLPKNVDKKRARLRLRTVLGRMTKNKPDLFPKDGDGDIFQMGQPPLPAWFGWRWHEAYRVGDEKK